MTNEHSNCLCDLSSTIGAKRRLQKNHVDSGGLFYESIVRSKRSFSVLSRVATMTVFRRVVREETGNWKLDDAARRAVRVELHLIGHALEPLSQNFCFRHRESPMNFAIEVEDSSNRRESEEKGDSKASLYTQESVQRFAPLNKYLIQMNSEFNR